MSEEPKSAYEVVLEKLKARDAAKGGERAKPLTARQKKEIAEIRNFYAAKLAEREILHNADRRKAGGDPDKLREMEENYFADRRRLESERDAKIEKLKA